MNILFYQHILIKHFVLLTSTDLPLSLHHRCIIRPSGGLIHNNHYKINYRYSETKERKELK